MLFLFSVHKLTTLNKNTHTLLTYCTLIETTTQTIYASILFINRLI